MTKRKGPEPLPENERKSCQILVRLKPPEMEAVSRAADGEDLGPFVRRLTLESITEKTK